MVTVDVVGHAPQLDPPVCKFLVGRIGGDGPVSLAVRRPLRSATTLVWLLSGDLRHDCLWPN